MKKIFSMAFLVVFLCTAAFSNPVFSSDLEELTLGNHEEPIQGECLRCKLYNVKKRLAYTEKEYEYWYSWARWNRGFTYGSIVSGGVGLTCLALAFGCWLTPKVLVGAPSEVLLKVQLTAVVSGGMIFVGSATANGVYEFLMIVDRETGKIMIRKLDEEGRILRTVQYEKLEDFIDALVDKHGVGAYDTLNQIEKILYKAEVDVRKKYSYVDPNQLTWYQRWWATEDTKFMTEMEEVNRLLVHVLKQKGKILQYEMERIDDPARFSVKK